LTASQTPSYCGPEDRRENVHGVGNKKALQRFPGKKTKPKKKEHAAGRTARANTENVREEGGETYTSFRFKPKLSTKKNGAHLRNGRPKTLQTWDPKRKIGRKKGWCLRGKKRRPDGTPPLNGRRCGLVKGRGGESRENQEKRPESERTRPRPADGSSKYWEEPESKQKKEDPGNQGTTLLASNKGWQPKKDRGGSQRAKKNNRMTKTRVTR